MSARLVVLDRAELEVMLAQLKHDVLEGVRAQLAGQQEQLLDVRQAAEVLRSTEGAVRRKAQRGRIPCVRHGRSLRFRRCDLVGGGK